MLLNLVIEDNLIWKNNEIILETLQTKTSQFKENVRPTKYILTS